jgi:putative oxidoreductase
MAASIFDRENFGKLFIRVVLGTIIMGRGVAFFVQGKGTLVSLGNILSLLGMNFSPLFFGVCVAVVCVVGGITFALGAFFRTSSFLLGTVTVLDAIFRYHTRTVSLDVAVGAVAIAATLYGFMFIGAGAHAVQR